MSQEEFLHENLKMMKYEDILIENWRKKMPILCQRGPLGEPKTTFLSSDPNTGNKPKMNKVK